MSKPNLTLPLSDDQIRVLNDQIERITDYVRKQAAPELAEFGKHFTPINDGGIRNHLLKVIGRVELAVEPTAEVTKKSVQATANLGKKIDALLGGRNIGAHVRNKIYNTLASEAVEAERNRLLREAPVPTVGERAIFRTLAVG